MICNLHTHTKRCRHATGEDIEYVERAIEGGLKTIGFSDHAPFRFPDGFESHFRVPTEDAEEYIQSINRLKEEFKNEIDIKIGFEMEYYPLYFKDMLKYVCSLGAEYLLLGQHFTNNERPYGIRSNTQGHNAEELVLYVNTVIEGIESRAFTYVAHPDMFRYDENDEIYKREMRRLCRTAKKENIPLEINFLGIRDNRAYPNPLFWQVVGEEGCSVVFGFDAHEPKAAYDDKSLEIAKQIVLDNNLEVVKIPKLIDPKKAL